MPQANLMELNKEENADHYVISRKEKSNRKSDEKMITSFFHIGPKLLLK